MSATPVPAQRILQRPRRPPHRYPPSDAAASTEASWVRPALIVLLACSAAAYLWDLSASGYANSFYAAAVQAGTKSWKAFLFGSLDSSNFITVDKPPASLWVMALSGRIFGFSSWSMLVPQALEGVLAVALLFGAIRRWFGAGAGLLAGALLAITPVAALMFRFNNPDALLVCLLVASAYCLTRALERAHSGWVIAAGSLIGLAFLTKMMQAFLILPAFGAVYLLAAPTELRRRLWQLLAGALAIVVTGGWWVALVALWPAGSRPFVNGSPDNNIFNLITGYNGLERIFAGGGAPGGRGGAQGGPGGGQMFSGPTGLLRLFDTAMGGQASWLLPAALLALGAGLWMRRRAPRTDRARAALLLWGGWLIVSGLVFSLATGVIHTYYTVALAPAIAALIAIAASLLWPVRHTLLARAVTALAVLVTAAWSWTLLDRTPQWQPWLRGLIAATAFIGVVGLLAAPLLRAHARPAAIVSAALALIACLGGPLAYSAQTIATAHSGSIPSAGPTVAGAGVELPGGLGFARAGGLRGSVGGVPGGAGRLRGGAFPPGASGSPARGAPGLLAGGGAAGVRIRGAAGGLSLFGPGRRGSLSGHSAATGAAPGPGQTDVSKALVKKLETGAGRFRWVAATDGSQSAASLELATGGEPVMAIGGFNGQGGHLTLAQFERYVAGGEIHYYITSGGAGGPTGGARGPTGGGAGPTGGARGPTGGAGGSTGGAGGSNASARGGGAGARGGGSGGYSSSAITAWVEAHFKAVDVGGQTVYDLSQTQTRSS